MVQKRGLGRGLSALIPGAEGAASTTLEIPLVELEGNPLQPRQHLLWPGNGGSGPRGWPG